jgi:hypothetical protein
LTKADAREMMPAMHRQETTASDYLMTAPMSGGALCAFVLVQNLIAEQSV